MENENYNKEHMDLEQKSQDENFKKNFEEYDEDENEIDFETITDDTGVMTILEVQGIKCSSKSFQIEIEMKQLMVLRTANIFEKCIIRSASSGVIIDSKPDNLICFNTDIDKSPVFCQVDRHNSNCYLDNNKTITKWGADCMRIPYQMTHFANGDTKVKEHCYKHDNSDFYNKLTSVFFAIERNGIKINKKQIIRIRL